MKTTFETALDQHEIADFFKGKGIYFARGSDWGDHLYICNWQEMCGVLKTQSAARSLLTNMFEEYAKYLGENYEDAAGLLSNITAYYVIKHKFEFLSADNYDLVSSLDSKAKEKTGKLFRLLRSEHDKQNKDLPNYTFEQEIQRLEKLGCTTELESL
ncbi:MULTISPECIES: hypothetical protein [unclassified Pseudomonas]|uniref:hypothetical protein n=1 Tax=unclassified Pseudomonas TaxID=196821 RepID=UPI00119D73FD|nr:MULTISPECIES: hypothetical protein [unclassified Pseudomonas]TWC12364.1 hypothetical protein FBY05_13259 [Pseudomonas sp. SJZ083]TWC40760.1 hypothetical protein FBY01_1325 [Pseudomonas sp. SJZ077]